MCIRDRGGAGLFGHLDAAVGHEGALQGLIGLQTDCLLYTSSGAYQRHGLGGDHRKPDAVHADDKRQGQDGHDLEQQRAQEGLSLIHI